jgi:hypothetical protein
MGSRASGAWFPSLDVLDAFSQAWQKSHSNCGGSSQPRIATKVQVGRLCPTISAPAIDSPGMIGHSYQTIDANWRNCAGIAFPSERRFPISPFFLERNCTPVPLGGILNGVARFRKT